jgi:uncharacterized protein
VTFASSLIRTARGRAGLTQAELGRRAGTSQSAVALYEAGTRSPTMDTLERILAAAGFELRARLELLDDHDEVLARWFETLPDGERERFHSEQRERLTAS